MTSFGYNVLGFGVGGGPLYTSQVFTTSGTYTPSDGVTSALFMVTLVVVEDMLKSMCLLLI